MSSDKNNTGSGISGSGGAGAGGGCRRRASELWSRSPGPAPLAMLPLTEVDYAEDLVGVDLEGRRLGGGDAAAAAAAAVVGDMNGESEGEDEDEGAGSARPWHNPNLMKMVESLRAAMMAKRDALAPLPIE